MEEENRRILEFSKQQQLREEARMEEAKLQEEAMAAVQQKVPLTSTSLCTVVLYVHAYVIVAYHVCVCVCVCVCYLNSWLKISLRNAPRLKKWTGTYIVYIVQYYIQPY